MRKAHEQIRRSQVITTYGPGALIDLPHHSAIIGGLDTWPGPASLEELEEPRLVEKLRIMTGVTNPRLDAPPLDSNDPREPPIGICAWRFPEWFVVQDEAGTEGHARSRRLVHRMALDRGRFDGHPVVATRFVRACPRGHVDDVDWRWFVRGNDDRCMRQLWLDERGTSGDPFGPDRPLRVRQAAEHVRCHADRAESPRYMPRRAAVARTARQRRLHAAQPPAYPDGVERLLPAGPERALIARSGKRGGCGSCQALGRPADRG